MKHLLLLFSALMLALAPLALADGDADPADTPRRTFVKKDNMCVVSLLNPAVQEKSMSAIEKKKLTRERIRLYMANYKKMIKILAKVKDAKTADKAGKDIQKLFIFTSTCPFSLMLKPCMNNKQQKQYEDLFDEFLEEQDRLEENSLGSPELEKAVDLMESGSLFELPKSVKQEVVNQHLPRIAKATEVLIPAADVLKEVKDEESAAAAIPRLTPLVKTLCRFRTEFIRYGELWHEELIETLASRLRETCPDYSEKLAAGKELYADFERAVNADYYGSEDLKKNLFSVFGDPDSPTSDNGDDEE